MFAGIRDSYSRSGGVRKEEESRIDTIFSQVDELQHDNLLDFVQRLFPKMENIGYGYDFLESWRKQGRICSPDIFDTYFKLSIPKDEISMREIERILSAGNDIKAFSNELLKLNKNNKIIRFLERMEDYTREDIPEENIAPIINALMDVGDIFPDETRGILDTSTPMRILRIFYQLSHRYKDHEKRSNIFVDAINYAKKSLYTIVNEVAVQCQQHGKYGSKEKPEPPEKTTVNSHQLDELVALALKKIEEWVENGKLAKHDHLLSILFMWRRWSDPDRVNDFVQELIKDDKGLIEFIKHFLSEARSHGLTDYVEKIRWRINLESVETFVKINEVDNRLRKIQSKPQYNELDDKAKLAIKTFIDTRDGKIKDRF